MIYIHIPFCRSFCTYCDFYSELSRDGKNGLFGRFVKALSLEIGERRRELGSYPDTLYIGGGTPSVLPLSVLTSIMKALSEAGVSCGFTEFTVEVNPDDIVSGGRPYLDGLLELGVNRISMGVQSLDDGILRWMNRRHDARTAVEAYSLMRSAGFSNISVDLIYGISQLDDVLWRSTVEQILALPGGRPEHVSAYQLSIEPGSALASLAASGRYSEASDEKCAGQYEMLCALLSSAGYRHYEISNFAIPGHEAVHNSAYWSGATYSGFGPGAHSYSAEKRLRFWNRQSLSAYIAVAEQGGKFSDIIERETLDDGQLYTERVMLALRTDRGIAADEIISAGFGEKMQSLLSNGDLESGPGGFVRIPESRMFVSDAIILELV